MDNMDIMDIRDIIDIMDMMDIMIITAWITMTGAALALVLKENTLLKRRYAYKNQTG